MEEREETETETETGDRGHTRVLTGPPQGSPWASLASPVRLSPPCWSGSGLCWIESKARGGIGRFRPSFQGDKFVPLFEIHAERTPF